MSKGYAAAHGTKACLRCAVHVRSKQRKRTPLGREEYPSPSLTGYCGGPCILWISVRRRGTCQGTLFLYPYYSSKCKPHVLGSRNQPCVPAGTGLGSGRGPKVQNLLYTHMVLLGYGNASCIR